LNLHVHADCALLVVAAFNRPCRTVKSIHRRSLRSGVLLLGQCGHHQARDVTDELDLRLMRAGTRHIALDDVARDLDPLVMEPLATP